MLDYVLVVAVGHLGGGRRAGLGVPGLQPYTLAALPGDPGAASRSSTFAGVRESGMAFMVPTYLFIVSLLAVLAIGVVKALLAGGHPDRRSTPPAVAERQLARRASGS